MSEVNERARLLAEIESKAAEIERLLDDEVTAEALEQAKVLQKEIAEKRAEIERLAEVDALKSDVFAAKQLGSSAAYRVPQPGTNVLRLQQSGETVIDGGAAYSEGAGLLTEKQASVLRSEEYKAAFVAYLRKGPHGLSQAELKQLRGGVDAEGGFLVPDEIMDRVVSKLPAPTSVVGLVQRFTTSRDVLVFPKIAYGTDDIYSTGFRVTWTGEVPSSSTVHRVTGPTFAQVRIPIYTAMMSRTITRDLIEDAAVDVLGLVADKLTETALLAQEAAIISGTGSGQPSGILQAPGTSGEPAIIPSGAASELTAAGLQNLVWSIPGQYEDAVRIVMNKVSAGKAIAQMTDEVGRYLWGMYNEGSGLMQGPGARTLLGYPVVWSSFMPNVAANAFPVIAGDLSGYYLVQRVGLSIEVLRELYAELNQVVVLARMRFGGDVAEEWKLKVQKVAAS